MRLIALLATTATLLCLGEAAHAQACTRASNQADLDRCAGEAFQRADARLNTAYRAYSAKLSPESRAGLKTAQRAWLAFRDADCAFRASAVEGGSAQPMVLAQCKA